MNHVIEYLAQKLNSYLAQKFDLQEDLVLIGRLVDADGSKNIKIQNKLILSIVNVTTETSRNLYNQKVGFANRGVMEAPPLLMNVDLLLSANFLNEMDAAKYLTEAIRYLHKQPFFSNDDDPSFPSELEKVTLEMYNLSFAELDALWSAIGTGMIPSALYKVRISQLV